MSNQLSRIRNLITEIDQIQKLGQVMPKVAESLPFPVMPTEAKVNNEEKPLEAAIDNLVILPDAPQTEQAFVMGKVAIRLTGNVVVQLQIDDTNEVVEVSRIENAIKISFSDGKAVHLPLKAVA